MIKWRTIRSSGIRLLLPVLKVKRQFDIKIYKLRLITLNNMAGSNERKFVRISRVWGKMDTEVPREPRGQGRDSRGPARGQVMSVLPPSPLRSEGLGEAPGEDARIALHLRPHQETTLEDGKDGGLRAPD